MAKKKSLKPKGKNIEFYKNKKGEIQYRVFANNGNQLSTPGESFKTKKGAEKNLLALYKMLKKHFHGK